jgi:hypothetical protein
MIDVYFDSYAEGCPKTSIMSLRKNIANERNVSLGKQRLFYLQKTNGDVQKHKRVSQEKNTESAKYVYRGQKTQKYYRLLSI